MRWSILVAALLCALVNSAGAGRDVRLTWLPSRVSNTMLRIEATSIAQDVASQVGGRLLPASSSSASSTREGFAKARELLREGAVDEAADAYDAAILRVRNSILEVGDGSE